MLIVIDMQYDFLPTKFPSENNYEYGDAFGVSQGDDIKKEICEAIQGHEGPVALTRDYHPCQHVSFAGPKLPDILQRPENVELCEGKGGPQGPFPPHCVHGSQGAMIHEDIENACESREDTPRVFFKGFCPVESFGGAAYPAYMAKGRLPGFPQAGGCMTNSGSVLGTGSYAFPGFAYQQTSSKHESQMKQLAGTYEGCQVDAYMSLLKQFQCVSLEDHIRSSNVSKVVICGLALDFCVIDTSRTLQRAVGEQVRVHIATDCARPAYVPPGGYLTTAADLLTRANGNNVSFVKIAGSNADGFDMI